MSGPHRRIPASGINLFQLIYILIQEYEKANGRPCLNLSLGNPDFIPPPEVLALKSRYAGKAEYDLHTYGEDKNLNGFCEGLVEAFTGLRVQDHAHLRAIPIAGIKTATAILPLACGLHLKGREKFSVVTNLPAYDVMGTWSASYLGAKRIVWPLSPEDGMRLSMPKLEEALKTAGVAQPDLIFVIRPGNPAAVGATRAEWEALCRFCEGRGIRLVNDGAYTTLTTDEKAHVPLAQVAKDFPNLEWAELLSVSKSFSDPGQRLGALVGSQAFVEDFILMKGNTDSGPVPYGMAAYGELFKDRKRSRAMLDELNSQYRARLDFLVPALKAAGLEQACETSAGFFTLWRTPKRAFGLDLASEAKTRGLPRAELFNRLVIEKTGIVGVHFQGPPRPDGSEPDQFIRYAVCTDVLSPEFQKRFAEGVKSIAAAY